LLKFVSITACTLFFIVLLCIVPLTFSQPSQMWNYAYGAGGEEGFSVVETNDGGYVIAGTTTAFGAGKKDVWLFKVNSEGTMIWNQTYGGPLNDRSWDMVKTNDNGFAIGGYVFSFEQGTDALLIKTDSNGNMQWNKTIAGGGVDYCFSLIQTFDGGYALAGETTSWGHGDDFWLVKTNSNGNVEWNQTYGEEGEDRAWSVIQTKDAGYVLAGKKTIGNVADFYLVRTDSNGNMIWEQTFGGSFEDIAHSVVETSDGGFLVVGETSSYAAQARADYKDVYMVKTDSNGNMQWNRTVGTEYHGIGYCVTKTNEGGYAIAASWSNPSDGNMDYWVIKIDENGFVEWEHKYGTEYAEWPYSIIQSSDGGYVLAGDGHPGGDPRLFVSVIKTDEYGDIPEFPSWISLPLFLIGTIAVVELRKKLKNNKNKR